MLSTHKCLLYIGVCMLFCSHTCLAQINQVNTMAEVMPYFKGADYSTLAIFDIDMVLVQPKDPAFQMDNIQKYKGIAKAVMASLSDEKRDIFLNLMLIDSEYVLIDSNTPKFLQELSQSGIPIMALTAGLTGNLGSVKSMQKWKVDQLSRVGIDFAVSALHNVKIIFNQLPAYRGNYSLYQNGILFANGPQVSKGDLLVAFLKKNSSYPSKIVFIDDKEDYVKNVEEALKKIYPPIAFQGLVFKGTQNTKAEPLTADQFERRWKQLAAQAEVLD